VHWAEFDDFAAQRPRC